MKIYYILLTLFSCFASMTQAADIRVDHCSNCGSVLVGAAKVEFNKIRWEGGTIPNNGVFQVLWGSDTFGFTGAADSSRKLDPDLLTYDTYQTNKWLYWGGSFISLWQIEPNNTPYMGFYFSPGQAGQTSVTYSYEVIGSAISKKVDLTGEGVADSSTAPVLGLDISTQLGNDAAITESIDSQTKSLSVKDTVTFKITPKRSANLLTGDMTTKGIKETDLKYAMVELAVSTKSSSGGLTECAKGNGSLFRDIIQRQRDNIVGLANGLANESKPDNYDNYYQAIMGENTQTGCSRYYYFLVSLEKTFQLTVEKSKDIPQDYAEYTFFIRGHYDFKANSMNYPGSHKTFRLSTSEGTVTPTPTQKTVTITGATVQPPNTCQLASSNAWTCSGDAIFSITSTITGTPQVTGNGCFLTAQNQIQVIFGNNVSLTCGVSFTTTPVDNTKIEPSPTTPTQPAITTATGSFQLMTIVETSDGEQVSSSINPVVPINATDNVAAFIEVTFAQAGSYTVNLKDLSGNIVSKFDVKDVPLNKVIALALPATAGIKSWETVSETKTLKAVLDTTSSQSSIQLQPKVVTQQGTTGNWDWSKATTLNSFTIQRSNANSVVACIALQLGDGTAISLATNPSFFLKSKTQKLVACPEESKINPQDAQYTWHMTNPSGTKPSIISGKEFVVDASAEGTYVINLVVRAGSSTSVTTINVIKSNLSADFSAITNAEQVTLTAQPQGMKKYIWWQEGDDQDFKETTGNELITLLNHPANKVNSTFFLQIISPTDQQDATAKVVTFAKPVIPTPKVTVSLPQSGQLSFRLDASQSCDEDNILGATDLLTMKNACASDVSNKGITSWLWNAGLVNSTTGVQVVQPTFGQPSVPALTTVTVPTINLTDDLGTANTVQVPVKLTVTDDDPNAAKSSSIDVTLTLNRPKAEGFTVSQNANGTKTVTAAFNITDQVKSSYSYSTSNNSTPISIADTKATSSISCEWTIVPKPASPPPTTECSVQTQLSNGEYTISLTVTDNYGLKSLPATQTVFVGDSLLPLSDSYGRLEKQEDSSSAPSTQEYGKSKFFGVICIDGDQQPCAQQKEVSRSGDGSKGAYFHVNIQTDPPFANNQVDILLVLAIEDGTIADSNTGRKNYFYYSVTNTGFLPKNPSENWLFDLTPYVQPVTLGNNYVPATLPMRISDLSAQVYYLFYGYQYTEGNSKRLVYAPNPLILKINN